MKRIFYKIFLGYLVLIIMLSATILYFSFNFIHSSYQNTFVRDLEKLNHSIEYDVEQFLSQGKIAELDSMVKKLGAIIDTRITIMDPNGIVLADSKSNPSKMENHSDRPEFEQAKSNKTGVSVRHSQTVKKDMLYVAIPLKTTNGIIAVSRFSIYMDDFDELIYSLKVRISIIVLIILGVSILFALYFSRSITKPVHSLVKLSKDASAGNFKARVKPTTNDELKHLSHSFNNMLEKIDGLFSQTLGQKEELHNIISSIKEGLAVTDSKGLIVHSNPSFDKYLNNNISSSEKYIWEIIREVQVKKLLKKIQDSEESLSIELQIKDEYYLCSVNKINAINELVFIFSNISEFKKLENIKKDFFVNVSHELRTPLTVIKGYLETIEDNPEQDNSKFIAIIQNHTNRLINIVQDLLSISMLEEKGVAVQLTNISLEKMFADLELSFQKKMQDKNIEFKYSIQMDDSPFYADEFKLEQMFINLVDNAVKYSEKGTISILAKNENSQYIRLEICDTGNGIPDRDKDRVFERFYTVDKSRSRQLSGTGLGLAIVKHIVMLHQGKIRVEDNPGGGSKFVVTMPLNLTKHNLNI